MQQPELFPKNTPDTLIHAFTEMKGEKERHYLIGLNFRHMCFPHLSFPRDCRLQKERQPLALQGS